MNILTSELKSAVPALKTGDKITLTGYVYTARDAVHKKLSVISKEDFPFPVENSVIYYAGPTDTKPNMVIGSCGPTTSGRMDVYTPRLLDMGLSAIIGKGERSPEVINAIVRNKAVYFCAIGGAGALAAERITSCEVAAFPELGCESVKRLYFDNFPLIVGIDSFGNDIFNHA
jgi:fumarate hydratase subunit beta